MNHLESTVFENFVHFIEAKYFKLKNDKFITLNVNYNYLI